MKTWLQNVREDANCSPEDYASILHCSRATYLNREKTPGTLSLNEFFALYRSSDSEAQEKMWAAIEDMRP